MRLGTSYFPTFHHAATYYRDYAPHLTCADLHAWIQAKLDADEIHLGTPPLRPHQRAVLIDSHLRYAIETTR